MPERANAQKYRCHVLSIRENPADEYLIKEIWGRDAEIDIITLHSGAEALTYLQTAGRNLPNLIMLAAVFPSNQMTAFEVLHALKADDTLRCVPVIVLAGPLSPRDTQTLYRDSVACVIEIPSDLDSLERIFAIMKELWLGIARLPYEHQDVYPGSATGFRKESDSQSR